MNRSLSHEEAFELLDALAFDALEGVERDVVVAHVETCDICRNELAQLRETVAMIGLAAPAPSAEAAESRDRVRSRLLARAEADGGARRVETEREVPPPQPSPRVIKPNKNVLNAIAWRRAEWMSVAAGILLVASVSVSMSVISSTVRERNVLRDEVVRLVATNQQVNSATDSLRHAAMTKDSIIAGLTGRDVAMMTLTSAGTKAPFAHMFWDKSRNTWTMVAHNMPSLKPGRTYQLWLLTADRKISAGTFEPNDGDAMVRATMALNDKLMALAVTEEPMGGMPQPTGSMVMVATAH